MVVVLVHHADALSPAVDPQRALSEIGRAQADWVAAQVKERGLAPAAIWHSGKLRSRQTAEACLRTTNPFADYRMIRGLQPEDPPEWLRDELAAETRDVLIVGHMPHIARLLALLAPGNRPFPTHGMVALERREAERDTVWTEIARADINARS